MNTISDNPSIEKNSIIAEATNSDSNKENASSAEKKIYAQIPLQKVFFMTIVSLGLYILIWLHRNWRIYSIRNQTTTHLWVRTFFFPITCLSLFKDMTNNTMTAAGFLALQWIPLAMYYAIPQRGYLILFTQAAIFTFVQNTINQPHDPAQESKTHYKMNIPCIIVSVVSISLFMLVMLKII